MMQKKTDNKNSTDEVNTGFKYQESLKKPSDHFLNKLIKVERYVNRPLASLIVRLVYHTRITPNGLTIISFFLGILGAFFLSRGQYLYFVLGGVSIQLSSIMDCADGQLARSKNMCSEFGSHLDIFLDRIMDFFMILGISIGIYTKTNDNHLLLLGFLTAGLYMLQINIFYLTNSLKKDTEKGQTGEARALMLLLVMIFSIANLLKIAIYILLAETIIVNTIRTFYFMSLGRKNNTNAENKIISGE